MGSCVVAWLLRWTVFRLYSERAADPVNFEQQETRSVADAERQDEAKLDAIRFCIGPWQGRYSSMWRIWSHPKKDDIYLGVTCLLQKLKISLHESGKCRVAFVPTYHEELVEDGADPEKDRAFMKWEIPEINARTMLQVLDIHFPLSVLSHSTEPPPKPRKMQFIFSPHESSIGANDTITIKIIFHKEHPNEEILARILKGNRLYKLFGIELSKNHHASVVACYTKQLPIRPSKIDKQSYGRSILEAFLSSGMPIGSKIEGVSTLFFRGGRPPAVYSVGGQTFEYSGENSVRLSWTKPIE